jgi:hypothetical protein
LSAFGLALAVDPAVEIPGLARNGHDRAPASEPLAGAAQGPPTRVRLDPEELARLWGRGERVATRTGELREGGEVVLTVGFAPSVGYLMKAPGFARILVTADGMDVICAPESGSPAWTVLLCAQALPLAATLRGLEVLHASGVVMGGSAALFTGPPGAGKSSLAGALLRRGGTLLGDDTVALGLRDGRLVAHPGAALLYLRADEHERLSAAEREALGPSSAVQGKLRYSPAPVSGAVPFGALFLLERSPGAAVERVERVDPIALLASTFNLSVRTPERLTRHLDLALALARSERVYRLRIQPGVDAGQLAQTVHGHLRALA